MLLVLWFLAVWMGITAVVCLIVGWLMTRRPSIPPLDTVSEQWLDDHHSRREDA